MLVLIIILFYEKVKRNFSFYSLLFYFFSETFLMRKKSDGQNDFFSEKY